MIRLTCALTWLAAITLLVTFSTRPAQGQENVGGLSYGSGLPLSSQSAAEYARYDSQRQDTRDLIRQRVQFEAQQRVLREQWYQWIGHSPARPSVNASYTSSAPQRYYLPSQGRIVTSGPARSLYW